MARREEVSFSLTCPGCGKTGRITIEENENPVFSGLEPEVLSVSDGFTRSKKHDKGEHLGVICTDCHVEARY